MIVNNDVIIAEVDKEVEEEDDESINNKEEGVGIENPLAPFNNDNDVGSMHEDLPNNLNGCNENTARDNEERNA